MKLILNILFVAVILNGCAHNRTLIHPSNTIKVINYPELNVESEAEIGQSMVSTSKKAISQAIETSQEIIHNGSTYNLTIPAGILPIYTSDNQGTFYRTRPPSNLTTLGVAQPDLVCGIYIPLDKTKPTHVFWMGSPYDTTPVVDAHAGIDFKLTNITEPMESGFQKELIYSGISQNTISILYREFLNDMARPAFSQELKYDLSQDRLVGFQGARFEIIKADNNKIRYKVIKNID